MNKIKFYIMIPMVIIILMISKYSYANFVLDQNCRNAYVYLYKLQINNARVEIEKSTKNFPKNGVAILMESYAQSLEMFSLEDINAFESYVQLQKKRISKLQKEDQRSPWKRYCIAEVKIHTAFIQLKMGEETNAMLNISSAYKLLEENAKLFSSFQPNKKSLGLLKILIGTIPSSYNWVLEILGFEGSIEEGIQLINEHIASGDLFAPESQLLKIVVDNYIIKAHRDEYSDIRKIYENNPNNTIVVYLYSNILIKNALAPKAIEILSNYKKSNEEIAFPFIELLKGELNLYAGNYPESRQFYSEFLKLYKGKNSLKDVQYKLFLTYYLQDKQEESMKHFNAINSVGTLLYDSDKAAQRQFENKTMPDKQLIRLRYYTDGGYFKEAEGILNTLSLSNFERKKDKIEYLYRSARFYHKIKKSSDAITYYTKTIELTGVEDYYFAPNACLQLGFIYLEIGNTPEAKMYFEKTLTYKNYEYRNSIENKAKAALIQLNGKKK